MSEFNPQKALAQRVESKADFIRDSLRSREIPERLEREIITKEHWANFHSKLERKIWLEIIPKARNFSGDFDSAKAISDIIFIAKDLDLKLSREQTLFYKTILERAHNESRAAARVFARLKELSQKTRGSQSPSEILIKQAWLGIDPRYRWGKTDLHLEDGMLVLVVGNDRDYDLLYGEHTVDNKSGGRFHRSLEIKALNETVRLQVIRGARDVRTLKSDRVFIHERQHWVNNNLVNINDVDNPDLSPRNFGNNEIDRNIRSKLIGIKDECLAFLRDGGIDSAIGLDKIGLYDRLFNGADLKLTSDQKISVGEAVRAIFSRAGDSLRLIRDYVKEDRWREFTVHLLAATPFERWPEVVPIIAKRLNGFKEREAIYEAGYSTYGKFGAIARYAANTEKDRLFIGAVPGFTDLHKQLELELNRSYQTPLIDPYHLESGKAIAASLEHDFVLKGSSHEVDRGTPLPFVVDFSGSQDIADKVKVGLESFKEPLDNKFFESFSRFYQATIKKLGERSFVGEVDSFGDFDLVIRERFLHRGLDIQIITPIIFDDRVEFIFSVKDGSGLAQGKLVMLYPPNFLQSIDFNSLPNQTESARVSAEVALNYLVREEDGLGWQERSRIIADAHFFGESTQDDLDFLQSTLVDYKRERQRLAKIDEARGRIDHMVEDAQSYLLGFSEDYNRLLSAGGFVIGGRLNCLSSPDSIPPDHKSKELGDNFIESVISAIESRVTKDHERFIFDHPVGWNSELGSPWKFSDILETSKSEVERAVESEFSIRSSNLAAWTGYATEQEYHYQSEFSFTLASKKTGEMRRFSVLLKAILPIPKSDQPW